MQSDQPLWVTHQKKVLHVLRLGVIVALIASAVFAAQPNTSVKAAPDAACTNNASTSTPLNWNSAATWSCGHVPTINDDVVIANDTEVDITAPASARNLTLGSTTMGFLSFSNPVTLAIGGNFDYTTTGLFDAITNGGMIQLVGTGSQTINTHGDSLFFWDLKKVGGGQTLVFNTGAGVVTVQHNLTLRGSSSSNLILRSATPNTAWKIESLGSRDLNWLDVEDSTNVTTTGPAMSVHSWLDTGRNAGWASDADTESSVAVATPSNPVFKGQSLSLNIRVYPAAATGEVEVRVDAAPVAGCEAIPVDIGPVVTCDLPVLALGAHAVDVTFTSNSSFANATSTTLVQVASFGTFIPITSK